MPVYDQYGREIPSVPIEELEYVCTIGGDFDRTIAILNVYSENLDKHEVSNLLEVAPTKAWNPQEPHSIGNKGKNRVVDWGKWQLKQATPDSALEQVEILLSRCTSNLDSWRFLTEKYEVWLSVVGYLNN